MKNSLKYTFAGLAIMTGTGLTSASAINLHGAFEKTRNHPNLSALEHEKNLSRKVMSGFGIASGAGLLIGAGFGAGRRNRQDKGSLDLTRRYNPAHM